MPKDAQQPLKNTRASALPYKRPSKVSAQSPSSSSARPSLSLDRAASTQTAALKPFQALRKAGRAPRTAQKQPYNEGEAFSLQGFSAASEMMASQGGSKKKGRKSQKEKDEDFEPSEAEEDGSGGEEDADDEGAASSSRTLTRKVSKSNKNLKKGDGERGEREALKPQTDEKCAYFLQFSFVSMTRSNELLAQMARRHR
jgi:hypothetical protein